MSFNLDDQVYAMFFSQKLDTKEIAKRLAVRNLRVIDEAACERALHRAMEERYKMRERRAAAIAEEVQPG